MGDLSRQEARRFQRDHAGHGFRIMDQVQPGAEPDLQHVPMQRTEGFLTLLPEPPASHDPVHEVREQIFRIDTQINDSIAIVPVVYGTSIAQ